MRRTLFIWMVHRNIFKHVTVQDQLNLARSCSDARTALIGVADLPTLRKKLERAGRRFEVIDILTTIARDMPYHYACEQCLHLHRVEDKEEHVRDVAMAQMISEYGLELRTARPHPALAPPCRRRRRRDGSGEPIPWPDNWTEVDSSEDEENVLEPRRVVGPMTFQQRVHSECRDNMHTLVGNLSAYMRRTPLSGLAHRDVYLLLKQVRLFNEKRAKLSRGGREFGVDLSDYQEADLVGILQCKIRRALEPYAAQIPFVPCMRLSAVQSWPINLRYWFMPRVIVGLEGKLQFLLKTVVEIPRRVDVDVKDVKLAICPHQLLNHHQWAAWERDREDFSYRRHQFDSDYLTAWHDVLTQPPPPLYTSADQTRETHEKTLSALSDARMDYWEDYIPTRRLDNNTIMKKPKSRMDLGNALESGADADMYTYLDLDLDEGEPLLPRIYGQCRRCMTEYAIAATHGTMQISVWQDFGTEAPMTSETWQMHLPGYFLQAESKEVPARSSFAQPNTWQASGPGRPHSDGFVRQLFERAESAVSKQDRSRESVVEKFWNQGHGKTK